MIYHFTEEHASPKVAVQFWIKTVLKSVATYSICSNQDVLA